MVNDQLAIINGQCKRTMPNAAKEGKHLFLIDN
jgi:hypothetical protein